MSANIIEVPGFTTPITVPTAGNLLTAATTLAPLQALANRTALFDALRIRSVNRSQGSGVISAFATLNTGSLTTIGGISNTIAATAGDLLFCMMQTELVAVGTTIGRIKVVHSSPSLAQTQLGVCTGECTLTATVNKGMITMIGYAVAGFSETYTVQVQGFDELGAGCSLMNNWSLITLCVKGG